MAALGRNPVSGGKVGGAQKVSFAKSNARSVAAYGFKLVQKLLSKSEAGIFRFSPPQP